MTHSELRPQRALRIELKHSLSAEVILPPTALAAAVTALISLTIEENLRLDLRSLSMEALNFCALASREVGRKKS